MKKLILFLGIFIIILGVYSVQQYFSYMGPQLAVNQAIKNDIERVRLEREQLDYEHEVLEKQIRREVVTNTLPYAILTIFVIVLGSSGLIIYLRYDKRKESWHRQIEGSYALQDLVVNGVKWKVDVNKSPSGAIGVAPNGMLLQAPVDNSFGADRQLTYNNKIQNTRTATAVTSGENGIPNAATGKFLAGAYDRNQKQLAVHYDEAEEVKMLPVKLLNVDEAINQSTENNWIVGQSEDGTLSEINLKEVVNIGIVGNPHCGKSSSTALMIAMYARKFGYHVVVLDAKGLLEWTPFSLLFEVHKTNSEIFPNQVKQIGDIYTERKKTLTEMGIQDFNTTNKHGFQKVLFVLEEFGGLCDELKVKNPKEADVIIKGISKVLRDCRSVGLHFVIIDQDVSRWDTVIKSIIKYWISYKMGASAGQAIKFYYLDKLANVGEFSSSDDKTKKFKAWYTKKDVDLRTQIKPCRTRILKNVETEKSFIDPFAGLKKFEVVENTEDEDNVIVAVEEKNKRYYEDLTDDDKELIKNLYNDGQSFRTITNTIFHQHGKFYNDIVRKVLSED